MTLGGHEDVIYVDILVRSGPLCNVILTCVCYLVRCRLSSKMTRTCRHWTISGICISRLLQNGTFYQQATNFCMKLSWNQICSQKSPFSISGHSPAQNKKTLIYALMLCVCNNCGDIYQYTKQPNI